MRIFVPALLALPLLVSCSVASTSPQPLPAPELRTPDEYQVIMWNLGGIPENQDLFFQRLRELNINGLHVSTGDDTRAVTSHGFGFYVENIHRIAFLHDREAIYDADRAAYLKTRDKVNLIRKPCLHDPAYLAEAKRDIQSKVRFFRGTKPLLYNLGDECSITSFASPMDYCFSPYTLAAFRTWLQGQYGSLARLNGEWETSFAKWDDVMPMTTFEIKDRGKGGGVSNGTKPPPGSENYAPWADFRTFMDLTFAEAWGKFRGWVREVDPQTPVGLEGLQHPAAWGGFNLWNLSQVVDWLEPYDIGESHAIFRSFVPRGTPILATVFEHDAKPASQRLWHLLLNGDRGNIIWCSSDWLDYKSPDLTPQPWTKGFADLFAELRGPAAKAIMNATRDQAKIAIHYSHPSIQVGWMLDSREDGDTWPNRSSSWDSDHSRLLDVRRSWCRLLEDLGLQYEFVSTEQIRQGVLQERGYQVFIMPQSTAIGDQEALDIKQFAEGGGAVIADCLPGLFDEHGRRRAEGLADELFGLVRPAGMIEQPAATFAAGSEKLRPAEPGLKRANGQPAIMMQQPLEQGRVWYLNVSPVDYATLRTKGQGQDLLVRIGAILTAAGVTPAYDITIGGRPPVGCEVITYHADGRRYLALLRSPEYRASALGELNRGESARPDKPAPVRIDLGREAQARELLTGRDFGKTRVVEVTLDPWRPVIVEVR